MAKDVLEQIAREEAERREAERIWEDLEIKKLHADNFIRASKDVVVEDIYAHTFTKRKLLREYWGYKSLKTKGGNISTDAAKKSRVGNAFRERYETAEKTLGIRKQ